MNTDELPVIIVSLMNDIPKRYTGIVVWNGNGDKSWYKNGELHRDDGPAYERPDGAKAWFLNDKRYSFEEFFEATTDEGKEALIWRMHEYL